MAIHRLKTSLACALVPLSSMFWVRQAAADNPDRFYMSGEAALTAGAITADTNDTGSVWYNPAGLARSPALRFDVNVSAYALRLGGAPELTGVGEGTNTETVSVLNFAAVPTAFSAVRNFGNVSLAVGVFVPQMGVTGLRSRVTRPSTAEQLGLEVNINNYHTTQELFGGPGIGWHLAPGVDIGASFFIHYRSILDAQDYRVILRSADGQTALAEERELADWLQLGIAPTFGVQLQFSKRLRGGILFRLPSIRILNLLGYTKTETSLSEAGVNDNTEYTDEASVGTQFLTPARFNAGLSYQFERLRLALEGSYQLPFRSSAEQAPGEASRPTFNGRVGARYQVKDNFEVGGGFFTNMSTTESLTSLGSSKINFYGITIATKAGVPYKISEREGKKLSPEGRMHFGSSFAFTYALGVGQTLHGEVGSPSDPNALYQEKNYNVIAHEWIFSVGSTLFEE